MHVGVSRKLLGRACVILIIALLGSGWVYGQQKAYNKRELLDILRKNSTDKSMSVQDFERLLARNGVDFEMTSADEARFRNLGAAPEIIEAIRRNYRPVMPPGTGALVVSTSVGACSVTLDGQARGVTNGNGQFVIRPIKAGPHKLLIRKDGYEQQERQVLITAGVDQISSFTMAQPQGRLTVTTNIDGAELSLDGVQYPNGINDLSVPPGVYELRAARRNYQTFSRTITISPGQPLTVEAKLEPVPIDDLLNQIAGYLRANNYQQVINAGRDVLASHPDNGRANLLVGTAYFLLSNYAMSAEFLAKAVALGEQVPLPIRHHHAGFPNDGLCTGVLTIGAGALTYNSVDKNSHNFSVPVNKIYELKSEPGKGGRVHVRFGLQNGSKEDKKTYNFQVSHAYLTHFSADPNSILVVRCNDCGAETELVYQLIKQLREAPPTLASSRSEGTADRLATVPDPSSNYRDFVSATRFKLQMPDNWKEIQRTERLAVFAPDGAYVKVGEQMNFFYGIEVGTISLPGVSLQQAGERMIAGFRQSSPYLQQVGTTQQGQVKSRPAIMITLNGKSPTSQVNEFIRFYGTMLKNGDMFFLVTVVPREKILAYDAVFGRILSSLEFLD